MACPSASLCTAHGGATSHVAILAFLGGLARIGPTDTATVSTMEPVVTLLLAVALLGESLAPLQLLGGAGILAAVVWLARGNQISVIPQPVRDPRGV